MKIENGIIKLERVSDQNGNKVSVGSGGDNSKLGDVFNKFANIADAASKSKCSVDSLGGLK